MELPDLTPFTDDQLVALSADELIALARGLRRDDADADMVISRYRSAYTANLDAITRAFVTIHAPFAVGERLRLLADGSEWSVGAFSHKRIGYNGPTGSLRYVEITMQRFNRDGRLGEVERTWTFMAGNAADVARFERVGEALEAPAVDVDGASAADASAPRPGALASDFGVLLSWIVDDASVPEHIRSNAQELERRYFAPGEPTEGEAQAEADAA